MDKVGSADRMMKPKSMSEMHCCLELKLKSYLLQDYEPKSLTSVQFGGALACSRLREGCRAPCPTYSAGWSS